MLTGRKNIYRYDTYIDTDVVTRAISCCMEIISEKSNVIISNMGTVKDVTDKNANYFLWYSPIKICVHISLFCVQNQFSFNKEKLSY